MQNYKINTVNMHFLKEIISNINTEWPLMSHKLINDHLNPIGIKDGCLIDTFASATPPVYKYCSLNAWYRLLINVMLCLNLVWVHSLCQSQVMQISSGQNEFCHAGECYVWQQPPMVQSSNTPQSFLLNHTNNIVKIIITTTNKLTKYGN